MTFLYEQLGPERFQHFAQALILAENPGLQCLPVAQPDGGRDAFLTPFFSESGELIVYQIKYVRDPFVLKDPHKWLIDQMKTEASKVGKLISREISKYYLVTNVKGSSHLDVGAIDRLQKVLDEALPVPSMTWWRDDLDRRVEVAPSALRWSYPELLRGSDVLELLVDSDLGENKRRRVDAIKAFVTDQFERDEEVRFKQVELQNDLLSLFVDVPAVVSRGPGDRRARYDDSVVLARLQHRLTASGRDDQSSPHQFFFFDERPDPIGAAALLLDEFGQKRFQFAVIEGAPGQGKSTLAQFICQVYRMRLKGDAGVRALTEAHSPKAIRLPIKVDLTEYALWQSGKNPFSVDSDDHTQRPGSKHLESFVSALISEGSGGSTFSVDDLHAVLRRSSVLLVLDGLDEVAETRRRDTVIKEINAAARRLKELAPDIQIVVTTRPSAFAGVSDFSSKQFYYFQLVSLGRTLIADYAERWTAAKKMSSREAASIRRGLKSRLTQPHVRDLATNPMQLAILLSVIHSRGSSLPDKRTALYDIYVELFLARESEKTVEVREHNELLVDVHRFLAYTLQSKAEAGGHLGRIGYDSLMEVLRTYLIAEGRDPALAIALFTGAQRVVFLVARIEGTFEFEVQPLREYFAGKYLYSTSTYSPPGNERGGTMPDRFDALCRNPYWLNVTRFFAGSLNKGELPALVDRLQALIVDPVYSYISYPRFLAATLLADWVFSQHQRSLQAVVDIVLDGPGLRALSRDGATTRREVLTLPSGAGRDELIESAFKALDVLPQGSLSFIGLAEMLNGNADRKELLAYWLRWFDQADPDDQERWITVAYHLGLLVALDAVLITTALREGRAVWCARLLYRVKRFDILELHPEIFDDLVSCVMNGVHIGAPRNSEESLGRFIGFFSPYMYRLMFNSSIPPRAPMIEAVFGAGRPSRGDVKKLKMPTDARYTVPVTEIIKLINEHCQVPVEQWRRSITLWSSVIEPARAAWGTRHAILLAAMLASTVTDSLTPDERALGLLDDSADLCKRLRGARLRAGNHSWWQHQISSIASSEDAILATTIFFVSAGPTTLSGLLSDVDAALCDLDEPSFEAISRLVKEVVDLAGPSISRRRVDVNSLPRGISDRSVALLGLTSPRRVQVPLKNRYLSNYSADDPIILDFCATVVVDDIIAAGDSTPREEWLELVRLMNRAYRPSSYRSIGGVGRLGQRGSDSRTFGMPGDLAHKIAADGALPDVILMIAENVCELNIFEDTEPLAQIAKREDWFSSL